MIRPPSTLFLAKRSGCQAITPSASPLSTRRSMSSKPGRPGVFALLDSSKILPISTSGQLATSFSISFRCDSIESTWRSSDSVDLRQYRKYLMGVGGWARQRPREERVKFQKLRGVIARLVVRQGFFELLLPETLELADVCLGQLHDRYRSPRGYA